jgi:hypothetical protein
MSGTVFVCDQILLHVSFDAARRQLQRLAPDSFLLSASEYAYAAGITGLAEEAGLAAVLARLAGARPGDVLETKGCARLPLRWQAIGPDGALFPALDAGLTLSPAGQTTHGARAGRRVPAPPPGGSGARPSRRVLLRRCDHPQLYRPARLRPHPPRWHSNSGRPPSARRTAAVTPLNAIEVPKEAPSRVKGASPADLCQA